MIDDIAGPVGGVRSLFGLGAARDDQKTQPQQPTTRTTALGRTAGRTQTSFDDSRVAGSGSDRTATNDRTAARTGTARDRTTTAGARAGSRLDLAAMVAERAAADAGGATTQHSAPDLPRPPAPISGTPTSRGFVSPEALQAAITAGGQLGAAGGPATTPLPSAGVTTALTAAPQPAQAHGYRSTARVWDAAIPDATDSASFLGTTDHLRAQGGAPTARAAAENVQRGLDYYGSRFGRAGVDERGSAVEVILNDQTPDESGNPLFEGNGAYWTTIDAAGGEHEAIRWGSGIEYEHRRGGMVRQHEMLWADDLSIHELTHGIIKHETGGELGGTADEAGATNESFADVMAATATRDWVIGEGMFRSDSDYRHTRNIAQPKHEDAVEHIHTTVGEVYAAAPTDGFNEHYASGVISHAAYRTQFAIGGERGWQVVENVFYRTLDAGRLGSLSFSDVAAGLRISAGELYGAGSYESQVVDWALRQAGV